MTDEQQSPFYEKNMRRREQKQLDRRAYHFGRYARKALGTNGAFGNLKDNKNHEDLYADCIRGTILD